MAVENAVLVVAGLFALGYLRFVRLAPSAMRSFCKTFSVALLALASAHSGMPVFLTVALGLCAIGDLCLSRPGERAFMAGVFAFALGHLSYVAVFIFDPNSAFSNLLRLPAAGLAILLFVLGVVMARMLGPKAGDLKLPVLIYIPIILSMGIAAMTLPLGDPYPLLLVSAFMFVLSDIVLAFETFVIEQDSRLSKFTPFVIWPLYWGAQLGFLLSFS